MLNRATVGMKCRYCKIKMSDEDAIAGGHPGCLEQKNDRRQNGKCIKCGRDIDDGTVFHVWCEYSGYVLKKN